MKTAAINRLSNGVCVCVIEGHKAVNRLLQRHMRPSWLQCAMHIILKKGLFIFTDYYQHIQLKKQTKKKQHMPTVAETLLKKYVGYHICIN